MADKDVLDKKTLDKYRKQIERDFRDNYEEDLVRELSKKVSDEVTSSFNTEYKAKIVDEVSQDVKSEVKELVINEEKRLVRGKSFKIFRLSVYIFVLLAIIIYVAYRLYVTDNIDIVRYDYNVPSINDTIKSLNKKGNNDNTPTTTEVVKDFNYYNNLYGNMMTNFKIYDSELYKGSTNANALTNVQKLQIAFSSLTSSDISSEGSIHVIKAVTLKNAYAKLFDVTSYEDASFSIFDINYVYSASKDEYIAIYDDLGNESIVYDLFDITEDDNYIIFKAYVGKVIDNKVFNIQTNKEVGNYTSTLGEFKNKLSISTFRFTKDMKFFNITNE